MPAKRSTHPRSNARSLTTAEIIEMALEMGDTESLEALTLRRLAERLGVGTMTLYSYFRNKEEILDAMADHVLGELELPDTTAASAGDTIRAIAHSFLAMMREHPTVVRLLSTRVTGSHHSLKGAMEQVLAQLDRAGLHGERAVQAYGLVMTYALGFATYQHPRPWGRSDRPEAEELRRQQRHFYASMPITEFPNLVELSGRLTTLASDEQFEFGLECLVSGFLARIGMPDEGATPPPAGTAARNKRR